MDNAISLQNVQDDIKNETGVILYFYNDDCAPCISLRPKVEKLVNERFAKMKMIWVNSKTFPEIPASYGVFANPGILIFFEGKEFRRFSKYVSVLELEEAIGRYYAMAF